MNFIYQPTPMEEAYAYYLYRTVFATPTDPNHNDTNDNDGSYGVVDEVHEKKNTIHIKGKYMVPFLSKASSSSSSSTQHVGSTIPVSRDALRTIWNIVDPHTLGYISSIQPQFITILRYIALLQQQNNHITITTTDAQQLQQVLYDTAQYTNLPLAQFDGYPIPVHIMSIADCSSTTTASATTTATSINMTTMNNTGWDALDALSATVPVPVLTSTSFTTGTPPSFQPSSSSPVLVVEQQQQQQPLTIPSSSFDTTKQPIVNGDDDDDDFGDFVETTTTTTNGTRAAIPVDHHSSHNNNYDIDITNGWGALDALVESTDVPLPSLQQLFTTSVAAVEVEPIVVAVDPLSHNDNDNATNYENTDCNESIPAPVLLVEVTTHSDDDDTCGLDADRPPHIAVDSNGIPMRTDINNIPTPKNDGGCDAFDAFVATNNDAIPIPSLLPPTALNQNDFDTTIATTIVGSQLVDDESDGFGDFVVSSAQKQQQQEEQPNGVVDTSSMIALTTTMNGVTVDVPRQPDDDNNVITSSTTTELLLQQQQRQHPLNFENGWDALDALAATTTTADIPLPPLQQSIQLGETNVAHFDESESDGFGDFVVSPPKNAATSLNTTSLQPQQRPDDVVGATTMTTATTIADVPLQHNDDLEEQHDDNILATEQQRSVESGWDALDALASTTTSQTPLPPILQSINHDIATTVVVQEESESDGFGDFAGTTDLVTTDMTNDGTDDNVTRMMSVEVLAVTPLDSLITAAEMDRFSTQTTTFEMADQNPPVNLEPNNFTTTATSDMDFNSFVQNVKSGWDAMDDLNNIANAPLSSLADFARDPLSKELDIATQAVDEDVSDGFGDFVGDDCVMSKPALADSEDVSDGFGDFFGDEGDAFKPAMALSTTSEDYLSQGFGGYVGDDRDTVKQTNADHEDVSDGFGDFVGDDGEASKPAMPLSTTSEDVLPQEPDPSDINDDPSNGLLFQQAVSQPRPINTYDRTDSAYYSAQAKSVSSDSDINNYEDAIMNGSEVDTNVAETIQIIETTNVDLNEGLDVLSDSDDPFSGISSAVTTPLPIPTIGFLNERNILQNGNTNGNTNGYDAFTDLEGGSDVNVDVTRKDEIANDIFSPHNDVTLAHAGVIPITMDSVVDEGDFGDFETANDIDAMDSNRTTEEIECQTINDNEFGNFNDFGSFESSFPTTTISRTLAKDDNDTLSSRNRQIDVGLVVECDADWTWTREQIIMKSTNLPTNLRQAGIRLVDFGCCFDANIGRKFPLSESRIHQIVRCANILDRLSSSVGQELSKYWVEVFSTIKKELLNGTLLLHEAVSMDPDDLMFISKKLRTYVRGLKEHVRVSRWIVATVADLLMLDVFTMLSEETISSAFLSSTLAIEACEIEQHWEKVQLYDQRLELGGIDSSSSNRLEDLVEIRSRLFDSAIDSALCDFTLLPLPNPIKIESTQNVVIWSEKSYLVCTANLLSNKTDYFNSQSRRLFI